MAKVLRCRDAGMDCDVEIHAPERARDWIRPWNMRRRPITSSRRLSIGRLIFIPSVITLAVTLLRLIGELQHWSPILFNPTAGGGGAIMGITWLVLIFGVYFALKLSVAGEGPARIGKANLF